MKKEKRISSIGKMMKFFNILQAYISNTLKYIESWRNAMIRLCTPKKEFSLKKRLNAQFLVFVILKKILSFLIQDLSQFMSIWINYCLISNMIHQLLKFLFQGISKKMTGYLLMLNSRKKLKRMMEGKRKRKKRKKRRRRKMMMTMTKRKSLLCRSKKKIN